MERCDKEFLVTPALGLYCELLAQDKKGLLSKDKKEVLNHFKTHEDQVFPRTFKFIRPHGQKSEDKELFGEILTLLDELDLKTVEADELKKEEGILGAYQSEVDASGRESLPGFENFLDFLKGPSANVAADIATTEM